MLSILEIHTSGPGALYLIPEKMNTITFGYQENVPKKRQTTHTEMCLFVHILQGSAQQSGKPFLAWDTSSKMLKTFSCEFF